MNKWEELDKKYIWHPFTQMKGWVENPQLVMSSYETTYPNIERN